MDGHDDGDGQEDMDGDQEGEQFDYEQMDLRICGDLSKYLVLFIYANHLLFIS